MQMSGLLQGILRKIDMQLRACAAYTEQRGS